MPTAVVAIGGNSLLRPGERGTIEEQRRNLKTTCEGIAAVVAGGYGVVITHGNGPQVGAALLRSEAAADQVPPLSLDVCDAETQVPENGRFDASQPPNKHASPGDIQRVIESFPSAEFGPN